MDDENKNSPHKVFERKRKEEAENESVIEKLKKKLNRREYKLEEKNVIPTYYSKSEQVPESWNTETEGGVKKEKNMQPIFKKLFFASVVFFIIASGVAAYLFFGGGNVVSSENVSIDVLGPISTEGGEELSLQLVITNNNTTPLQFTDLLVEYPQGTHNPDDVSQELPRYRKSLDVIEPGESVNEIIRAVLFGEEESSKNIKITLEYRVEGSNAIFVKEKDYGVKISSSPLSVSMDILNEVSVNQEMDIEITVSSNSESIIQDTLLVVDYPFGFEPISSSPETTYSNNIWELGDISQDSEQTIRITGIIRGQGDEEKIFSAHVGKRSTTNEREIATVYNSSFEEVIIKKPFLGVQVELDGETTEPYVADSETQIRGTLTWTNNLPTKITDAVVELKITGDVLNEASVRTSQGFYNSSSDTILWNKNTFSDLASIEPGGSGRMSFQFSSKSLLASDTRQIRNPEIHITVSARGKREAESGVVEQINEFFERNILINSDFRLGARAVFFTGPFQNTGPLPPRVERETTYTIIWTVINSSNQIRNAEVTAVLPPYVRFLNNLSPGDERIFYNASNGEITWNIGDVPPDTGVSLPAKEVAFQVALLPSVSQVGAAVDLVHSIVLMGEDNFTGDKIEQARPDINTDLSTDPNFNSSQSIISP